MNLALLNPRVWLEIAAACIVAGVIWFAYHWAYTNGARDVQAQFDAYKLEQAQMVAKAEADNRVKEQGFQTSLENLTDAYIKNQKAHAASAASAADSLRELQAALDGAAARDPSAASSAAGRAGLESQLLGDCARNLVELAKQADGLEERLVALQTYVKEIVLRK